MNHSLSDPNNHVPAVTPDDDWDDADFNFEIPPAILPPKRQTVIPSLDPSKEDKPSLRIAPDPQRMKPTDVDEATSGLEVQEINGRVVRLESQMAAPKSPRQIVFQERVALPKVDKTEQGAHGDWGSPPVQSKRWLIWSSAGVLAAVVLGLSLLPFINSKNEDTRKIEVLTAVNEPVIEDADLLNAIVERQPDAFRMFSRYVHASAPTDLLSFIRGGDLLRDTISASFQPSVISKNWNPASDCGWSVMRLSGQPCGILNGYLPDHKPFLGFFVYDGKHLLMDWKATTGYGSARFSDLEKGQGDPREIRGIVSAAETYSDALPESEFQSYRFASPDGEISLWCYARRGEAAELAISPLVGHSQIIPESAAPQRFTLRLEQAPAGAEPNQWLVAEMLHIDWVAP